MCLGQIALSTQVYTVPRGASLPCRWKNRREVCVRMSLLSSHPRCHEKINQPCQPCWWTGLCSRRIFFSFIKNVAGIYLVIHWIIIKSFSFSKNRKVLFLRHYLLKPFSFTYKLYEITTRHFRWRQCFLFVNKCLQIKSPIENYLECYISQPLPTVTF